MMCWVLKGLSLKGMILTQPAELRTADLCGANYGQCSDSKKSIGKRYAAHIGWGDNPLHDQEAGNGVIVVD